MGFQEVQTDFGNQISSLRSQIALTPPQTPPNMKVCVEIYQNITFKQSKHVQEKDRERGKNNIVIVDFYRNYQMWQQI